MTSYLILVSVVALLAGSIFLLMRGLNEVRVAKGALDEVKKLFDVTYRREKLDQVVLHIKTPGPIQVGA